MLGKGGAFSPANERQQSQDEENKPQTVYADGNAAKNTPPSYANLPKGMSQPQQPGSPQAQQAQPQPQALPGKHTEAIAELEQAALDAAPSPEKPSQTPGRARMVIGQDIEHEEVMETLPDDEAVFIAKERAGIDKKPKEPEETPLPPSREIKTEEKKIAKAEKQRDTMKEMNAPSVTVEPPAKASELPGYEPSRREERGWMKRIILAKPQSQRFFQRKCKARGYG